MTFTAGTPITYQGETMNISDWARRRNINPTTMARWIAKHGIEEAMVKVPRSMKSARKTVFDYLETHPEADYLTAACDLNLSKDCVLNHFRNFHKEKEPPVNKYFNMFIKVGQVR